MHLCTNFGQENRKKKPGTNGLSLYLAFLYLRVWLAGGGWVWFPQPADDWRVVSEEETPPPPPYCTESGASLCGEPNAFVMHFLHQPATTLGKHDWQHVKRCETGRTHFPMLPTPLFKHSLLPTFLLLCYDFLLAYSIFVASLLPDCTSIHCFLLFSLLSCPPCLVSLLL